MKKLLFLLLFIFYDLLTTQVANLDVQNGMIWKYKTGGMISSSPIVMNGYVYLGSDDTYLYCLNAVTGESVWRYKTDYAILSTPVVHNNIVFIESGNIL